MATLRLQRVREAYKQGLSELIQRQLKDPRIGFVTVTDVEVTGDLRQVKAYVSILGDGEAKKETMVALGKATSFLRGEMGKRVRLRYTPELSFALDESIERGVRIANLLEQLGKEETIKDDGGQGS